MVDPSIYEDDSGDNASSVVQERKKTHVSDQRAVMEMTPASDESTETHTRKVAETADVVERGLASRGLARVSR